MKSWALNLQLLQDCYRSIGTAAYIPKEFLDDCDVSF